MNRRIPNRFTREDPLGLTWAERRIYDALAAAAPYPLEPREVARLAWAGAIVIAADEQLVRVHVRNIRRKLGQAAIETHHGRGYRLGRMREPAIGEAAS